MAAPLFDLLLLGYRNDLARERVLGCLRGIPHDQGGPIVVERDAVLPVVLRGRIDHDTGLSLLARLRDQGAQVRLVPNDDLDDVPVEPPVAPPPAPTPSSGGAGRLLVMLALCGLAAAAYWRVPLPRPLPPPPSEAGYAPPTSLFPAQLDAASHRLNDEAVALNTAGEFADAAGKLREAMQQAPAPVHAPAGFSRFYSFSERAPITGTWGDPRSATAEKGARFLAVQAEALADAIRDRTLWSRPDPVWRKDRGQQTTAGREE